MSPLNIRVNVARELERAGRCLRAADVLVREALPEDAVSDAYYASFHAMRALLFTLGEEPRSHRGALHLFNVHFILTGRMDARYLALVARAQQLRIEADYGTAANVSETDASRELVTARDFVSAVEELLRRDGWLTAAGS